MSAQVEFRRCLQRSLVRLDESVVGPISRKCCIGSPFEELPLRDPSGFFGLACGGDLRSFQRFFKIVCTIVRGGEGGGSLSRLVKILGAQESSGKSLGS